MALHHRLVDGANWNGATFRGEAKPQSSVSTQLSRL
jgi:hypothetical protein